MITESRVWSVHRSEGSVAQGNMARKSRRFDAKRVFAKVTREAGESGRSFVGHEENQLLYSLAIIYGRHCTEADAESRRSRSRKMLPCAPTNADQDASTPSQFALVM